MAAGQNRELDSGLSSRLMRKSSRLGLDRLIVNALMNDTSFWGGGQFCSDAWRRQQWDQLPTISAVSAKMRIGGFTRPSLGFISS